MSSPAPKTAKGAIGIDFGTTNSSIALANSSGRGSARQVSVLGESDRFLSITALSSASQGRRSESICNRGLVPKALSTIFPRT